MVGRTRTQQTGTRDRINMFEGRWMKLKRWRVCVYIWVKMPRAQLEPNIEGMRGTKSDKGVNWVTVSPTKRLAHH